MVFRLPDEWAASVLLVLLAGAAIVEAFRARPGDDHALALRLTVLP
jgi:hypothetical protein